VQVCTPRISNGFHAMPSLSYSPTRGITNDHSSLGLFYEEPWLDLVKRSTNLLGLCRFDEIHHRVDASYQKTCSGFNPFYISHSWKIFSRGCVREVQFALIPSLQRDPLRTKDGDARLLTHYR
jgi:hypothetical protein